MWLSRGKDMIKIGELSRITNVSIQTIRFYESSGLISPVMVDQWTNYRYYDESSVERLCEIVYLKDLGFSLNEIKNFSKESIDSKIASIKQDIKKLTQNIVHLSAIRQKEGKWIMKKFVNDECVVGKWGKVGVVKEKSDYASKKFFDENIFDFPTIYFLPKGEKYWVFSWTKGTLYLITDKESRQLPYEVENGVMFVGVPDVISDSVDCYAVYKKVDSKEYTIDDIRTKDNTDLPFENDDVVGFWQAIDFLRDGDKFDFDKKQFPDDLFLKKYTFEPNGDLVVEYLDGKLQKLNWTKGLVLNCANATASAYTIKKHGNDSYMFVEWKSGDYIFGGRVRGSYVFKKITK